MNKRLGLLAGLGAAFLAWAPAAQSAVVQLVTNCTDAAPKAGANIIYINSAGAVCVNATVTATATTTATASAAPTPVTAGTGKPLNIDLFSELFVQPSFGGQAVDASHGLPVAIVSGGGSGGTSSSFGAAFPAVGTAAGLTDGTNMIGWLGSATLGGNINLMGLDGTALGAPANYGTSPGAVKALSVNAFVTNNPAPMQSSGGTVGLVAGSAIVGNFRIDQTTPGTTNGVVVNSGSVSANPGARTLVTLDVKTVTTGGTAVTALTSGHKSAGGWLMNPVGATINLCINEIGTATGTTSSGDTTCIVPGQTYTLAPSSGAVSVISSDSSHPFSGYGLQ